ncbi:helix-turn-helix domain-containing protein [Diaphorobacter sp. HDW4A]|uniref:IclR family transcriptional regulator n=1 Tax=Diaphorobacter sp. HDW4A TaxID=2714924 RepID=UPI0014076C82|nr:IclR family transcriptional regulator C-terminal domain-containing protein [Diaphorobacter sp. HDW4A]QIL81081.1 helix-turn-helix domain-containing protein [Diaphorobacter sp. HDW4A]
MLAVLDLFTSETPVWTAESIATRLDCSIPTAYRYLRELGDCDLLRSAAAGQYVLGTRIIELDYQMRRGDPLLQAATRPMRELAEQAECDVALTALSSQHLLTIHYESSHTEMRASYGRGRRMPTFRGSASLALLSALGKPALRKLHGANLDEAQNTPGAETLDALSLLLRDVRKTGYATSVGALDSQNAGLAIAVTSEEHNVLASLGFVMSLQRFQTLESQRAANMLHQCAQEILLNLSAATVSGPL